MLSTILIVDKRKELSIKYKKSIEDSDNRVIIARTLKEALDLIQNLEPDVIIISDSIEEDLEAFCPKIRALTYNFRPVIIATSKSSEIEDKIKILQSGADDFISEPVNIEEFRMRIKAHIRRDIELNLDNKTLLPNQKYVRKFIKRALAIEKQAILLIGFENIDNYKSVYTELAADKLKQTFIAIAKSALDENDFIGHYDEKNFVIVTNKYNAEKLATFLTFAFDTVITKFYSKEDAKRGYMMLKGERHAGMRVNFVSIHIGGIVEGLEQYATVDALLERLIATKKLAQIAVGSNYVIDRTKLSAPDSIIENLYNKKIFIEEADDSLRYLLQTTLELQGYDIQDGLDLNNAEQPAIIIFDIGEDLSKLEYLRGLRNKPNFVNTKIIATSAIHDKAKILDSGADLYLPKPYEISDLILWIEHFFKEI